MDDDDDEDDLLPLLLPNDGNLGKSNARGGSNVELSIPNNSMGCMDTESKIKPIRLGAGCWGKHARVCTLARINVLGGLIFDDGKNDDGSNDWNRGMKSIILVTEVVVVVVIVVDGANT